MSFWRRLGFLHRRLWERDGLYPAAFLLGPPPLIGCAIAGLVWVGLHSGPHGDDPRPTADAAWAQFKRPPQQLGLKLAVAPSEKLPDDGRDGRPAGMTSGWTAFVHDVRVGPLLDVDVLPKNLQRADLTTPWIDMSQVVDAGPETGTFVLAAAGYVAVRKPGDYRIAVQVSRAGGGAPADCLVRASFGGGPIVRDLEVEMAAGRQFVTPAVEASLTRGLYGVATVFGCWSQGRPVAPGRVVLMIKGPEDRELRPVRETELLKPGSEFRPDP